MRARPRVVDGYALALAALLLAMGGLGDRYGRRRVYLAGLTCSRWPRWPAAWPGAPAAWSRPGPCRGWAGPPCTPPPWPCSARPTGAATGVIAFGVWGAVSGAAAAACLILGGLLTESLSWRWIFFVNLPVSVAALLATGRFITADGPAGRARLDVPGLIAFTAGASAVTFGLIRTATAGWTGTQSAGALALGLAAFAVFAVIERRAAAPLLDLALLRRPAFAGVLASALLLSAAAFAWLPYTSLWLQSVLGLSPIRAGLDGSAPLPLASFTVSVLAGRYLHAASPRWVVGGGLALIGAGALVQAAVLGPRSGPLVLIAGLVISGIGVGLATPTVVSNAMAAVPPARGGMAAGSVNTARQLGLTFGVAVLGSAFSARVERLLAAAGAHGAGLAAAVSGGQGQVALGQAPAAHRAELERAVQVAAAGGLRAALLLAGLLGLAAAVIAAVTLRRPSPAGTGPAELG